MAKPTSLPTWATGASASISEPTSAKKIQGWLGREKPPSGYVNWFFNLVGQWLSHYDSNGLSRWDTLEELAAAMTAGQVGLLSEYDPTVAPGSVKWSFPVAAITDMYAVSGDGRYIYTGGTDLILRKHERATGAVVATVTGYGNNILTIHANGKYVVVGTTDDHVYLYNASDLSLIFDYTDPDGRGITTVYCDSYRVYYGSLQGGGFATIRALSLAGVSQWANTGDWAAIEQIVSDGGLLHVVGSEAGGFPYRAYDVTTGTEDTNRRHAPGSALWYRGVAVDGDRVWIAGEPNAGGFDHVHFSNRHPTETIWQRNLFSYGGKLAYDGKFLLAHEETGATGLVELLNPETGAAIWRYGHGNDVNSVELDGQAAYLVGERDGSDNCVRRLILPGLPRNFRRMNESSMRYARPFHKLLCPS